MTRGMMTLDLVVAGLLGFVALGAAQPANDGFHGPLWVTDIQTRVMEMGVGLGLLVRFLKFRVDVAKPGLLLLYCFLVSVAATVLAMWEAEIALSLSHIKGLLTAAVNVTVALLGTGEAVDLGMTGAGIDIKKLDATRRDHDKISLHGKKVRRRA